MKKQFGKNLKKRLKCLSVGLLALSAAALALGTTAFAEEEYTYTVRLHAGNLGEITGGGIEVSSGSAAIVSDGEQVVISGLKYGDLVSIRPQDAAASTDARYYVRGVRRSGRDNSEAEAPAFYVGSDRDFVVAYGVSGDMAAYTVNYVDEAGNQVMASDTYYGNIGERQYVSSRYVEGYQPQALNMVRTLSANEAENVFDFVYAPLPAPTEPAPATPAPTPVAPAPAPAAPEAPAPAPEEPAGAEIPDEPVPLGGDTNAGPEDNEEQGGQTQQIGDEQTPLSNGQEFLQDKDIEDENVPLGTFKDEKKNTVMGYLPVYIGIGFAAVAALIVSAVLLKKKRKTVKSGPETGSGRSGCRRK
ncbi:MAG: MucBP domain-containing protein [Lachnospiraceae bacterium]|nr:MucBP domain-containing protein [Lachnospiraceae bacterium]